jgi:hypothetical protein
METVLKHARAASVWNGALTKAGVSDLHIPTNRRSAARCAGICMWVMHFPANRDRVG